MPFAYTLASPRLPFSMVSDYHNMHVSKFSRYYDFHVSMIWQQKGPLYEAGPCTQKHYQELPVPGIRQCACGHDHAVFVVLALRGGGV